MAIQIQFRRGTASEWTSANPVLALAEMGIETDTDLFKIGNGIQQWNSLDYGGVQGYTGSQGVSGYTGSSAAQVATNVLYVAKNGNDNYPGTSISFAKLTIKAALAISTRGTTIFVKSGDYTEINPMTIPDFVSIVGDGLRAVTVSPYTPTSDLFYVNNGCYLTGMTFKGHASPAAVVAFNPDGSAGVISTSPYVQNCTSLTGTGTGMRVDGNHALGLKSMVVDAFTQYNQGGIGIHMLNGGNMEIVSVFTICCDVAFLAESGAFCSINNSNSSFGNIALKANGVSNPLYTGKVSGSTTGRIFTIDGLTKKPNIGDAVNFGNGSYYTISSSTAIKVGATDVVYPTLDLESATYRNARQTILDEKSKLQVKVIIYLLDTYPGFDFNQFKCSRDVGLLIDAVSYDMVLNTNYQTIQAATSYYRADASVVINSQLTQHIAVFTYLKSQVLSLFAAGVTYNRLSTLFDILINVIQYSVNVSLRTATTATYVPITGLLTITSNAHGLSNGTAIRLTQDSLTFTCASDSYATPFSYPRLSDPANGQNLSISNATTNTFTVNVGISSNTSTHLFVSAVANGIIAITPTRTAISATYVPITGLLTITSNAHGLLSDNTVRLVRDSLTFTCASDGYATPFSYPRLSDPANGQNLSISNVTTNTFTVNVGISSNTSTHLFVSAVANGIIVLPKTPTRTATTATYVPTTGLLTITSNAHGLSNGNAVKLVQNSLTFTCASDSYTTPFSYPRLTDPANGQNLSISNATTNTFTVNVGISSNTSTHLFVSAIANGIIVASVAPAISYTSPTGATTSTTNAGLILQNNKEFIKEQTVAYINSFTYSTSTCYRDVGLIVDSLAFDLLFGGTSQSTFAGLQYWNKSGYTGQIGNQLTTTTNAIAYVKTLVANTASNTTATSIINTNFDTLLSILNSGTGSVSSLIIPNSTATTNTYIVSAYNAIISAKTSIQNQAISWITTNHPTFVYSTTTCFRDIGYIIDSAAFDLLYGGNRQSVQSATYYYGFSSTSSSITGEIPQTTAAYNFIRSLAANVAKNILPTSYYQLSNTVTQITSVSTATYLEVQSIQDSIDLITTIISNGPGSAPARVPIGLTPSTVSTALPAFSSLLANKEFIQKETIAFINKSFINVAFTASTCKRDIGLIIDAVTYDIIYGGNSQTADAADTYYDGAVLRIPSYTKPVTVAAYSYIKTIIDDCLLNTPVTPLQNVAIQTTSVAASSSATSVLAQSLINIVTNIVENGYSSTVYLEERNNNVMSDDTAVTFHQYSLITSSGHTFEWIGAGTNINSALPYLGGVPISGNNVVEVNGGKVFYTGTDERGDFRIGNDLVINRNVGTISGRTFTKSLFAIMTPYILAIG